MSAPWIESWLASKRAAGCLPETVERYRWAVERGERALRAAGRPSSPVEWRPRDVRWLRRRFEGSYDQLSILASAARSLGNDAFARTGRLRRPPVRRKRWLTEEETEGVLRAVRRDRHLRLVVLLALLHGLRAGDLVGLRVEDLSADGLGLRLRSGLTRRASYLWVRTHPAIPDALREYLWWRRRKVRRFYRRHPGGVVAPELFVHEQGGAMVPYRPNATGKWMRIIERRWPGAERPHTLRLELLRRRGAELVARRTATTPGPDSFEPDREVQRFLRQRRPRAARRYVRHALTAREPPRRAGGTPARPQRRSR